MLKGFNPIGFNKSIDLDEVKSRLNQSLSDADLRGYLGDDIDKHIIKYSELINYKNIEELLPHNRSYKIILIETEFNKGHWVCIMRYKNKRGIDTIEFFNSYGNKPLSELSFVKSCANFLLGQNSNLLKKLLDTTDKHIIYNKKRFQKYSNKINTCGKHVVCRLIAMTKLFFDLEDYIDYIEKAKKFYNADSDIVVSLFIPPI
jgi:hypothetical protein